MSKVSNIITMIEYLSTGKKYSIQELSELLEVSPRMIRIYKEDLEKAGIFVDTLKGPYGGYILNQLVPIPYLLFSNEDVTSLRECIAKTNDEDVKEKLKELEQKIKINALKEENKNSKFITDDKELKVYNNLNKAIKNNLKVRIKYYNLQHGESIRTIYPLGMYLFQGEWWCSSFWEEKEDMRQFHIKRIVDCELLHITFDPEQINIKF